MTDVDRVRTFHARQGRRSAVTGSRLEALLPRYAVPPGALRSTAPGQPPVVLEVGCGYGAAALGYATAYPGHRVVALDVYQAGVARLLLGAGDAGLTNLWAGLADAVEVLEDHVGEGVLAAVHLFFPDPWPKTRHRRRRFVSGHTLDLLASRLGGTGQVLVATDRDEHTAYVVRVVRDHGVFHARVVPRPAWRPVAGYEARALAAGRSVTDLRLERVAGGPAYPAR